MYLNDVSILVLHKFMEMLKLWMMLKKLINEIFQVQPDESAKQFQFCLQRKHESKGWLNSLSLEKWQDGVGCLVVPFFPSIPVDKITGPGPQFDPSRHFRNEMI